MSGTCIIESSEALNPNDIVITTTSGKIKKCTDENVIKTKVRYANKGKESN